MRNILRALFFILIFNFYIRNLCPTVYVGDSGEFIAAGKMLGIPHPPSFPAYVLTARLFSMLPLGNTAYRINLMSAFFGLLTLLLLYNILKKLQGDFINNSLMSEVIPLFTVLILAILPVFYYENIVSEVFTLNSFFVVLIVHLFLYSNSAELFLFLFAVSLGNHHSIVFITPGMLILFFLFRIKKKGNFSPDNQLCPLYNIKFKLNNLISYLFIIIIGLSIYLLPLFRSRFKPLLNVGTPDSVEKLFRVITRKDYGTLKLSLDSGQAAVNKMLSVNIREYFKLKEHNFGLLILVFALYGGYILYKKDIYRFIFIAGAYLSSGLFFYFLGNMPDTAQNWHLLKRFNIEGYIFFLIFFYYGFMDIIKKYRMQNKSISNTVYKIIFTLVVICIFQGAIDRAFSLESRRDNYLAYEYAKNSFFSFGRKPYFIMDGGDDIFYTSSYLVTDYGLEKEIGLFDTGGIVFTNTIYGKDYRRLPKDERLKRKEETEKRLIFESGRMVYYATMEPKRFPDMELKPAGLLYVPRVIPINNGFLRKNIYNRKIYFSTDDYRLKSIRAVFPYFDSLYYRSSGEIGKYFNYLGKTKRISKEVDWVNTNIKTDLLNSGKAALNEKKYDSAIEIFKKAIEITGADSAFYIYLGNLYLEKKDYKEALSIYEQAERIFPENSDIPNNAGVIYQEYLGDRNRAILKYLTAIKNKPAFLEAHYNLAVLYWKENNWPEVIKELEIMRSYSPEDERVKRYLPLARANAGIK